MALRTTLLCFVSLAVLTAACNSNRTDSGADGSTGLDDGAGELSPGTADEAGEGDEGDAGSPRFDVEQDTGGPVELCKVLADGDAFGSCEVTAPPGSFEPEVQWIWEGEGDARESNTMPLVANLTDDNGDGAIDLCDVPDIIVRVRGTEPALWVLDGLTGTPHFNIPSRGGGTPALGDVDGDGLIEIVTTGEQEMFGSEWGSPIVIYEHDGTLKLKGDAPAVGNSVALADVDNDGDVEIAMRTALYDHEGHKLWEEDPTGTGYWTNTVLADLDGDDDMEVIVGRRAFHHDGSAYFTASVPIGFPQVANLDDDPEPEVLLTTDSGAYIVEHDGTRKAGPLGTSQRRPGTVHDFDGDGFAEIGVAEDHAYDVLRPSGDLVFRGTIDDSSCCAGGTAFDFLGDGTAEAIFADHDALRIFDERGQQILEVPRPSGTLLEYPIVADVDNDGSAEIVLVSNADGDPKVPFEGTVHVIRDIEDRWIQARRIWNQHTYHVTNVREDGTIPRVEPRHWELLNTFRTNAQIEGAGGVCRPTPEG